MKLPRFLALAAFAFTPIPLMAGTISYQYTGHVTGIFYDSWYWDNNESQEYRIQGPAGLYIWNVSVGDPVRGLIIINDQAFQSEWCEDCVQSMTARVGEWTWTAIYGGYTTLSSNPNVDLWGIASWESEVTSSRFPELNEDFNTTMISLNRQYLQVELGRFSLNDAANLWISDHTGIFTYSTIEGHIDSFGAIPEPSTLALLGIGILGLVGCGWRRGRRG
jgi:hypothetical protein